MIPFVASGTRGAQLELNCLAGAGLAPHSLPAGSHLCWYWATNSKTVCFKCELNYNNFLHVQQQLQTLQELSSCWDKRLFGHNRHGSKSGGLLCPFRWGSYRSHLIQYRLGRGLPPYQVASWSIHPTIWPQYTNVTRQTDSGLIG